MEKKIREKSTKRSIGLGDIQAVSHITAGSV